MHVGNWVRHLNHVNFNSSANTLFLYICTNIYIYIYRQYSFSSGSLALNTYIKIFCANIYLINSNYHVNYFMLYNCDHIMMGNL